MAPEPHRRHFVSCTTNRNLHQALSSENNIVDTQENCLNDSKLRLLDPRGCQTGTHQNIWLGTYCVDSPISEVGYKQLTNFSVDRSFDYSFTVHTESHDEWNNDDICWEDELDDELSVA